MLKDWTEAAADGTDFDGAPVVRHNGDPLAVGRGGVRAVDDGLLGLGRLRARVVR